MLDILKAKLVPILVWVIVSLIVTVIALSTSLYFTEEERDAYRLQNELIQASSDKYKHEVEQRVKYFDSALIDIGRFFDSELDKLNNFERDVNETECEAADRLFDNFSY